MIVVYLSIPIVLSWYVYSVNGQNDGDFTDEVCFRIPEGHNIEEFYHKHTGFIKHKELHLGDVTWYCAKFNQSTRTKSINTANEDSDVQKLKDTKSVLWAEQQKTHIRVKKTSDTQWANCWHLNDDVLPSMKIKKAWTSGYTGNGIVIAILDDGLQTDHSDLDANVETTNDIDILDGDDDPSPSLEDSHGTNVGGLIAAERDNNDCTVGVAYQSKIVGVRILGLTGLTDSQEAQALSHYSSNVHIYSNSWGPTDGYGFNEPGTMTKAALQTGTSTGRGGKGIIYTWAAGNGGTSDNCNGDGYVNSIYTIGITSVELGKNAWYSEVCSAAMAATYGGSSNHRYLTTTTTSSGCTSSNIQGTSFSTPIVSGIIALALQANPNLTWRDIQHLIVLTSTRNGFSDTYSDWATNAAGKDYSQVLGFGFMSAEDMVTRAVTWNSVPAQQTCPTSTKYTSLSTSGSAYFQDTVTVVPSDCSVITYLEHVSAKISFSYTRYRGATELYLISPGGTESHILHYRYSDASRFSSSGSLTWTFMSVHFWRESPVGTWTLKLRSYSGLSVVTLNSWSLTFYGTTTDPLPNINQCSNTSCQNSGTCVNRVYTYSCKCIEGFTGTNCETKGTNENSQTTVIIAVSVTGTIVVVGGVVAVTAKMYLSTGAVLPSV